MSDLEDFAIERARVLGEASVDAVIDDAEANELQAETIRKLERLIRHGYEFIDIRVRKDGVERVFEGDWIATLFRCRAIGQ